MAVAQSDASARVGVGLSIMLNSELCIENSDGVGKMRLMVE